MSNAAAPSTPNGASPSPRHAKVVQQFVDFWGEMASTWGINRTMAQIHALLYCVERPLNTDDIMERLDISRGNANMNLRSLTDWELVEKIRMDGSRKDYYVAEKDVWQITARIIREREQRELRPVHAALDDCTRALVPEQASPQDLPEPDRVLHARIESLKELMEVFEGFSEALLPLVRRRNEPVIRQLIAFVRTIEATEFSNSSGA